MSDIELHTSLVEDASQPAASQHGGSWRYYLSSQLQKARIMSSRVQFVVSGKFIAFLLLAALCLAGGAYFWEQHRRAQVPPYYVNRTTTVVKPCFGCIQGRQLKPAAFWKFGKAMTIPAGETWWFSPVEEFPQAVMVDGVPMMAVHPAHSNNPQYGFDPAKILFVVLQDLQAKYWLEQPPAPQPLPPVPSIQAPDAPAQPASQEESPIPAPPAAEPETSADRATAPAAPEPESAATPQPSDPPEPTAKLSVENLGAGHWRVLLPNNGQWFDTAIPISEYIRVRPTTRKTYTGTDGRWEMRAGEQQFDTIYQNDYFRDLDVRLHGKEPGRPSTMVDHHTPAALESFRTIVEP